MINNAESLSLAELRDFLLQKFAAETFRRWLAELDESGATHGGTCVAPKAAAGVAADCDPG